MEIFSLFSLICALAGFSVAFYIFHKKRKAHPVVCPLRTQCNAVITSAHSKFFGIPLDILGLGYYGASFFLYGFFLLFPHVRTDFSLSVAFFIAFIAFLFSLYLTFLQFFVLRELCTWCLMSAFFSTVIFVLATFTVSSQIILFLKEQHWIFLALHVFAVALGFGAVLLGEVLFKKFFRDGNFSFFEADVFLTLSQVIWFAFGFLVLSGVGLAIPFWSALILLPKFLVKMIVVGVILLNAALLHVVCMPHLEKLSFVNGTSRARRRVLFVCGAVSGVSWFSAFLLGILRSVALSFSSLLSLYGVLVFAALLGGFFYEIFLFRAYQKKHPVTDSGVSS